MKHNIDKEVDVLLIRKKTGKVILKSKLLAASLKNENKLK